MDNHTWKQDHRFTRFNPKTRSYTYLSHKSIPRGVSVCQTPNLVTTTFPISADCWCIPCHFLSLEQNEYETLYSNDLVLKCCFSKQSFQWHQLDLHKSQFYNSWSRWVVFSNEHGEWKVTYVKLTIGKFNNSNAHENLAFCHK